MRSGPVWIACVLVVLIGGSIAGVAVAQDNTEDQSPTLVYDVAVHTDGDATWELRVEFPLDSTVDEESFEELAVAFEEDGGEAYLPITPYETAIAELSDALDRSMAIEDEERQVNQTETTGVLSVSFVWTDFAVAEETRIEVGDVFEATDQTWFARLEENERLVIRAPDNYTVINSGLPIQDRAMVAVGPTELEPHQLRATFLSSGGQSTGASFLLPLLGGLVGIIGFATLILLLSAAGIQLPSVTGSNAAATDPHRDRGEFDLQQDGDQAGERENIDTLLSDEERVMALIEARDGRMKQADIVTETDWSNAKVSQLLSQMADDGEIEKLRIGRENLIRLPDSSGKE